MSGYVGAGVGGAVSLDSLTMSIFVMLADLSELFKGEGDQGYLWIFDQEGDVFFNLGRQRIPVLGPSTRSFRCFLLHD